MGDTMLDNIKKTLDSVRPFLQADSGDVELIEVTDDDIVKVKFTGACHDCPMSQMTLRAGIERTLMLNVPSVKRVESIE